MPKSEWYAIDISNDLSVGNLFGSSFMFVEIKSLVTTYIAKRFFKLSLWSNSLSQHQHQYIKNIPLCVRDFSSLGQCTLVRFKMDEKGNYKKGNSVGDGQLWKEKGKRMTLLLQECSQADQI